MNIFIKLQEQTNLSKNEQILADYLLEHPEQALKMTANELTKQCYVSSATLYRLCDKLDISGFSKLKMEMTSSLDDYLKTKDHFDFDFPVQAKQTHYEIINKIKEDYEQTLQLTSALFDLEELRRVSFAMQKAKIIDVYTSAGNVNFALNFQFQMQEIGRIVNVPIDEYQQRLIASSSNSDHLAIFISFGGRGLLADILPRILHATNTPIVLISSPKYNLKEIQPDYHLYISPYENHYKKISSFSTRLSLLYILDVLYTCLFKLDYDQNVEKKLKYYDNIVKGSQISKD